MLGSSVHYDHIAPTFEVGDLVVLNIWFLDRDDPPFWFIHGLIALWI